MSVRRRMSLTMTIGLVAECRHNYVEIVRQVGDKNQFTRTFHERLPTEDNRRLAAHLVAPLDHLLAVALLVRPVAQQLLQVQLVDDGPVLLYRLGDANYLALVGTNAALLFVLWVDFNHDRTNTNTQNGYSLLQEMAGHEILAGLALATEQENQLGRHVRMRAVQLVVLLIYSCTIY